MYWSDFGDIKHPLKPHTRSNTAQMHPRILAEKLALVVENHPERLVDERFEFLSAENGVGAGGAGFGLRIEKFYGNKNSE